MFTGAADIITPLKIKEEGAKYIAGVIILRSERECMMKDS